MTNGLLISIAERYGSADSAVVDWNVLFLVFPMSKFNHLVIQVRCFWVTGCDLAKEQDDSYLETVLPIDL